MGAILKVLQPELQEQVHIQKRKARKLRSKLRKARSAYKHLAALNYTIPECFYDSDDCCCRKRTKHQ